jgi:hypothetical protein
MTTLLLEMVMFKSAIRKTLKLFIDRPLPLLSPKEKEYLSELQNDFNAFPIWEIADASPSEVAWLGHLNRLREHVLNDDPREFLRWDVILDTMFVDDASYVATELNHLKYNKDWDVRWRAAIKESPAGHPLPYIIFPSSSGNLIHHAYHLAQFEEKTSADICDMDYVFEFGGGYGSMCRLFFNLGFHGKYIIFDFPPFSSLQRYYLKTSGVQVYPAGPLRESGKGAICLSDSKLLSALLTECRENSESLFIATWSLSESPVAVREMILPLSSNFYSFLIAYQDRFGEVDNLDFFSKWKDTVRGVDWHSWPIEHIPGNNYLMGKRTE